MSSIERADDMKRVQIILEVWQHEWLGQEAERQSTSMSALLRQLLTEAIELRQTTGLARDPLLDLIGLAEGPDDGVTSANLDQFLYANSAPRAQLRLVAESSSELSTHDEPDADHC